MIEYFAMGHTNWAGNLQYQAARVHQPRTLDEVRQLIARAQKVKVIGTRHSFNEIADTDGDHVSLEHLNRVVAIEPGADGDTARVTVEGGIAYGQLCRELRAHGYALRNLASLPHISVAGACATATHGSGSDNANLATAVRALRFVAADGSIVERSRGADGDSFNGCIVSLGALGAVTRLTLDVVPTFDIAQAVYENLPLKEAVTDFGGLMSSAYSVSLFTDWRESKFNQVWLKRRVGEHREIRRDWQKATRQLHPIASMPAGNCTRQLGVPGPWNERLPHFRMEFTPSSGEELQSEYLVPRHHAPTALRAIDALRERIAPLLQICEVRTIAADELWMSPCYRQPCAAIHFTWDCPSVRTLLPIIEQQLAPFDPRPHWGKLFTMAPAELAERYPRWNDFRQLVMRFDPMGKFSNPFLDRLMPLRRG